jgi:hypothetical protein
MGDRLGLVQGLGAFWGSVLLFPGSNEDLAPAIGHDETGDEEVISGLEAAGGNVALERRNVSVMLFEIEGARRV